MCPGAWNWGHIAWGIGAYRRKMRSGLAISVVIVANFCDLAVLLLIADLSLTEQLDRLGLLKSRH
eukprot:COSAG02_NODE_809_length_16922_cov_11.295013_1_plen_65_part_00